MKRIFKWLFRLFLLAVALIVIFLLSYNSILRLVIQNRIREQTGMKAEIGKFSLSLFSPTIQIQNLKIYNPPDFGDTPFLEIPEIYVEYDRAALAQNQIHITQLRFNLGELDIVKNQNGRTNLFALGVALPTKKNVSAATANQQLADFKKQTGLDFQGIDALTVSVGMLKYVDLADAKNNREQNVDIENQIVPHIKTPADLAGLVLLVGLRSDNFFTPFIAPQNLQ